MTNEIVMNITERETRLALIEAALDRILPGGGLIQFSYGFGPPVKAERGRFAVDRTAVVWTNLPPARVWRYRRERPGAA